MMIALLIISSIAASLAISIPDETPTWGSLLHQTVVVKASILAPPPLQRQILLHRREVLRGCIDALEEARGRRVDAGAVRSCLGELSSALGSRAPFAQTCYLLGRLSTLVTEFSNPLQSLDPAAGREVSGFIDGLLDSFPLAISRDGEKLLLENSPDAYLRFIEQRNNSRGAMLLRALTAQPERKTWADQRGPIYGTASLVYNEMVMDTVRTWIHAWREAGGAVDDARYFGVRGGPERE